MTDFAWALGTTIESTPVALANDTFRKELIYEGTFRKNGQEFKVDPALMEHWVKTFGQFTDRGIKVPMPLGHTTNPEKRRAELVGLEVGKNARGLTALYGQVKFRDEQTAKDLKDSQVSIFVPPSSEDGQGNTYTRPITHVAITDYPVVPKLEGWEVLAASLSDEGEMSMSLRSLAEKLKLDGDDVRDDVAIESKVVSLFDSLKKSISDLKEKLSKAPQPKEPVPVAAAHLSMLRDNRSLKLDRLVSEGKLTAAARKVIEGKLVTDDALTLSFSNETDDGFQLMVDVLSANEPVISFGERSPGQTLVDPSITDPEKNALLKGAKALADAGK